LKGEASLFIVPLEGAIVGIEVGVVDGDDEAEDGVGEGANPFVGTVRARRESLRRCIVEFVLD
jgi:hypothetical protein